MKLSGAITLVEQGKILVVTHPKVGINVLAPISNGLMFAFTASDLIFCRYHDIDPEENGRIVSITNWIKTSAGHPVADYEVELLRIVPTVNFATFYIHRVLRTTGVAEIDAKLVQDGLMAAQEAEVQG